MKKIVLAFSGGLDTSFCVPYLIDKGFEVHTIFVNTGGITKNIEQDTNQDISCPEIVHKNGGLYVLFFWLMWYVKIPSKGFLPSCRAHVFSCFTNLLSFFSC